MRLGTDKTKLRAMGGYFFFPPCTVQVKLTFTSYVKTADEKK